MNLQKEKLLVSYLISSPTLFTLCASILKPDYFQPELKNAVAFILNYGNEYNAVPSPAQIKAEVDIEINTTQITRDQVDYCAAELEQFCKEQAMVEAVLTAADLINRDTSLLPEHYAGTIGKVRALIDKASMVGMNKQMGINFTFEPAEMLERLKKRPKQSSGWKEFDHVMEGGIRRKELLLWSAPPKGGKSITMQNMCLNLAEQGLKVLYISLELSTEVIWTRFAQMVSSIPSRELVARASEVEEKINQLQNKLDLRIEEMPAGSRPFQIRAYLTELETREDWKPDVIAIDYLDLCYPNEKDVSLSDLWTKDKLVAEQLRQILVDYDMYGMSASQLNRSAVGESTYNSGMIAGGISKINTTDDCIAIYQSDLMKAEGKITFQFIANRNISVDNAKIDLQWNRNSLRITDFEKSTPFKPKGGTGTKEGSNKATTNNKNSVDDLIGLIPQ